MNLFGRKESGGQGLIVCLWVPDPIEFGGGGGPLIRGISYSLTGVEKGLSSFNRVKYSVL